MSRLLLAGALAAIAIAGCLGVPGAGSPAGGNGTPTPSAAPATPGEPVSVEYVVRKGSIADGVAHVYVDFAVYFAAAPDDVYPCTDGAPLHDNRYDPTPTPLRTPAGPCKRFDLPRVDVAALDGPRSLGEFAADGTYDGGHTLVVHDVTVQLENGTTADDVYDTDFRAVTERTAPSGSYGVTVAVTDHAGDGSPRWRYGVDTQPFDPDGS